MEDYKIDLYKLHEKEEENKKGGKPMKNDNKVYSYTVAVDGKQFNVQIAEGGAGNMVIQQAAPAVKQQTAPVQQNVAPAATGGTQIKAELPGDIIEILVNIGDTIQENEKLLVIEAMKMMNDVTSSVSGTVTGISVSVGDRVDMGQVLITIG